MLVVCASQQPALHRTPPDAAVAAGLSPQADRGSPPCHHNTVSHNTVTVYRRAVIAVAWGAATLHSADDGHDCPIPSSGDDTDPEAHHDDVVFGSASCDSRLLACRPICL